MQKFQQRFGHSKMKEMEKWHPISDLEGLREKAQTRMVFAMRTQRWRLMFYLTSMNLFYLDYEAFAQLIDLEKLDVIWSGSCKYQEDAREGVHRPSLSDFLEDNGALMKTEIARAEEKCITQYTEQLF